MGTLLGLVSKFSLIRIGIDRDSCRACGKCLHACKAGCIDMKTKTVDTSRCVSCFNCLTACPDQAMALGTARQNRDRKRRDPQNKAGQNYAGSSKTAGRRGFMLALAAGGVGLAAGRAQAQPAPVPGKGRPTTIPETRTSPLCPPGSKRIARYTSICTACHLCVSACPSRVLLPSVFSFGLSGMMQPQMDFTAGHCNYDCTVCSRVCPSGAILALTTEEKQRTQVGVAKFIKENCVVYTDNTNCGACSEHCPTKAVQMVPYLNASGRKLVIPQMNEAICVGCGGCEHACPTKPYKAIYVDGNPGAPTRKKAGGKKNGDGYGSGFPFLKGSPPGMDMMMALQENIPGSPCYSGFSLPASDPRPAGRGLAKQGPKYKQEYHSHIISMLVFKFGNHHQKDTDDPQPGHENDPRRSDIRPSSTYPLIFSPRFPASVMGYLPYPLRMARYWFKKCPSSQLPHPPGSFSPDSSKACSRQPATYPGRLTWLSSTRATPNSEVTISPMKKAPDSVALAFVKAVDPGKGVFISRTRPGPEGPVPPPQNR